MTAREGGLARSLSLSLQALHEAKSIAAPVPLNVIADAIDPSPLETHLAGSQ